MFSLIISIIAIALVAALALASIYYGGSAFQEGSADAEASTVVNQGQQIQGAVTLADVNEVWGTEDVDTIAELVPAYIKEEPVVRGEKWALDATETNFIRVVVNSKDICEKIEERFDNKKALESVEDLTNVVNKQAFGCFEDSDASPVTYNAYYKL